MEMPPGVRPLLAYLEPIAANMADPFVTEVVVNKPYEVGVERSGKWSWREVPEFSFERLNQIAILAAYMTSRDSDAAHPFCNSTLPGGQRIQIARPPGTLNDVIALCIRNPPKVRPRMDDPGRAKMFDDTNTGGGVLRRDLDLLDLYRAREFMPFLKVATKAGKTIAACGITGSGKTQLLRTLMEFIEPEERMVSLQSDDEFGDAGPHNRVSFFYNKDRPGQTPGEAVETSLRFYPKTLAFQEVRGSEAFELKRAIGSGHRTLTSWHSATGDEIPAFCRMMRTHPATSVQSDAALEADVRSSFDIIVSCVKDTSRPDPYYVPRVWFRLAEEVDAS
jgi:type IV secretion system protein VirB11